MKIIHKMWWRNYSQTLFGHIMYQWSSFIRFTFIVCQVKDYRNILKLSCKPFTFTSYKAFLKNKKRFGTSLLASFSCYILFPDHIPDQLFSSFTSWGIGKYVYYNSLPSCDVTSFEINLIFLIKPFLPDDRKVKTKIQIFWEQKELLRWNEKHFPSILKGFHCSK